jgi:hypothetical protein
MKIAMPPRLLSKTIRTGEKLNIGFESAAQTLSNLRVSCLMNLPCRQLVLG